MDVNILCIEGSRGQAYRHRLEPQRFTTHCVSTGKAALAAMKNADISRGVLLNAYFMSTSGVRIAGRIKGAYPELPLVHITDGSPSSSMAAGVVLDPEPTIRILVNRFKLFSPFDLEQCTQVGDLVLDEDIGRVKTPDGVSSLAPKLSALLAMLMEHAGEVVHPFPDGKVPVRGPDPKNLYHNMMWS